MKNEDIPSTVSKLRKKADSPNWHLREEAGFALRDLMERHFEEVYPLIKDWLKDDSENVRRASCLACMQRKAKSDEARIKKVLRYLDTLMKDDSLYVRKCCGPFVVGYLGYTYPSVVLPWLRKKALSKDLNVRANVAKAFSQALAKNHAADGIYILGVLAEDQRSRVRSAVMSSARHILKLHPTARLHSATAELLKAKTK